MLLIDGGHGQVNAARKVLDDLGIFDIPVIGLIEGSETIVFGDGQEDLHLDHGNEALRLLIAVQ